MTFETLFHQYRSGSPSFPQPLKTFLGGVYGNLPLSWRFGSTYTIHQKVLETFETADEQFQLDFQYNKTLETLLFAQEHIPYYEERFKVHGVSATQYKSLDDITLFPLLTKQDIRKNIDAMVSNVSEKPVAYYSGGSLSTPTKYFLPSSSRAKEKAYNNYIFSKIGYRYRDKTLLLKGREISIPEKNIYWEREPIDNYLLLSNNYMNSDKFPLMHQKALEFQPKFLFGYPSAVLSFMKQSKLYGVSDMNIKGVILASETVYPDELEAISSFFGVDILTHYGHTERNAIAYRINTDGYHFCNSYGLNRVVDGELITTTFDNFVMPFINYKTTDSVVGRIEYYKQSDIAKYIGNIEGRTQDFLVTDDGRLVSITTMCGGQYLPLESMDAIQYIQKDFGKVTVLVEGTQVDVVKVKEGMHKLVRDGIDFEVKQVDNIEKTSRGKRVMCKQSLDIEAIRKSGADVVQEGTRICCPE